MSDTTTTSTELATTEEPTTEEPRSYRVNAKGVIPHALVIMSKAEYKEGISLTDLAKALEEAGVLNPEGRAYTYRQMHNVTHWLEGRPATGKKTFKAEPVLAERLSPTSKSYKLTALGVKEAKAAAKG